MKVLLLTFRSCFPGDERGSDDSKLNLSLPILKAFAEKSPDVSSKCEIEFQVWPLDANEEMLMEYIYRRAPDVLGVVRPDGLEAPGGQGDGPGDLLVRLLPGDEVVLRHLAQHVGLAPLGLLRVVDGRQARRRLRQAREQGGQAGRRRGHRQEWAQYRAELSGSDIYTLRRIIPKDRGLNWE